MKKVLISIDGNKQEVIAEDFDLAFNSGYPEGGNGYDLILAITSAGVIEPVAEGVQRPLASGVLAFQLPKEITFEKLGLQDRLNTCRSFSSITYVNKPFDASMHRHAYKSTEYSLELPNAYDVVIEDLIKWEVSIANGGQLMSILAPRLIFLDEKRNNFVVLSEVFSTVSNIVVLPNDGK